MTLKSSIHTNIMIKKKIETKLSLQITEIECGLNLWIDWEVDIKPKCKASYALVDSQIPNTWKQNKLWYPVDNNLKYRVVSTHS